jgi:hypothetical protein
VQRIITPKQHFDAFDYELSFEIRAGTLVVTAYIEFSVCDSDAGIILKKLNRAMQDESYEYIYNSYQCNSCQGKNLYNISGNFTLLRVDSTFSPVASPIRNDDEGKIAGC